MTCFIWRVGTSLLAIFVLCVSLSARALAEEQIPGASLSVSLQLQAPEPYPNELVLLKVRGEYSVNLARESLEPPDLRGFAWMMLGSDDWFDETIDGRSLLVFERIMAIYPQRSGTLTIGAFTQKLTILDDAGQRYQGTVTSAPVTIQVARKPQGADWWLPARVLSLTDSWDHPPDQLEFGQTLRRSVTLEAVGVAPEFLPPMPRIGSPGVLAFADPEERSTELTWNGPISRVTWTWTVKLLRPTAGRLPAIGVPWFNTTTRQAEEVFIAAQEIAVGEAEPSPFQTVLQHMAPAALTLGLALGGCLGLSLLIPGHRLRNGRGLLRPWPRRERGSLERAFRRAARRNDGAALRTGLHRLLRADDQHSGRMPSAAEQICLSRLKAALYGPSAAALDPLAHDWLRARRRERARGLAKLFFRQ